eukprot:jgi/Psemu1/42418/gm1.42418_g
MDPSVPDSVWTEADGILTVQYCVYLSLSSEDGSSEVNYLESVISVSYDLVVQTAIDSSVGTKGPSVSKVSKAYTVEAYKCVPGTGNPLDEVTADLAIGQGSLVTVCVKPTSVAISDGVEMLPIDSFQWIRAATVLQPSVVQWAIESSQPASNALTSYDDAACAGSSYCEVSSILFASFFETAGEVSGVGVATMRFSTEDGVIGRRDLLREGRRKEGFTATAAKRIEDVEGQQMNDPREVLLSFRALQQSAVTSSDFDILIPVHYGSLENRYTLMSAATERTATALYAILAMTSLFIN